MESSYYYLIKQNKKQFEEIDEFQKLLNEENNKLRSILIELLDYSKNGNNNDWNKIISCLNSYLKEIDCKTSKQIVLHPPTRKESNKDVLSNDNICKGLKISNYFEESINFTKNNKLLTHNDIHEVQ